jgi:hypothetical protein
MIPFTYLGTLLFLFELEFHINLFFSIEVYTLHTLMMMCYTNQTQFIIQIINFFRGMKCTDFEFFKLMVILMGHLEKKKNGNILPNSPLRHV